MQPRAISDIWMSESRNGNELVLLQKSMEGDYGSEKDRAYFECAQLLTLRAVEFTS